MGLWHMVLIGREEIHMQMETKVGNWWQLTPSMTAFLDCGSQTAKDVYDISVEGLPCQTVYLVISVSYDLGRLILLVKFKAGIVCLSSSTL